jgi:glyoxylase-like metal-dependent hydrolase (beta-lactamase superfamily II)
MNKLSVLPLCLSLFLAACTASNVHTEPAKLGKKSTINEMLALLNQPGPIHFEKHTVANWRVPLSGLINLDHPRAIAAGIEDREEEIQLYVYTLEHPSKGLYLVDSGISENFRDPGNNPDISFIVHKAMNIAGLEVLLTNKQLTQSKPKIQGVLLTHIHLDHIMGLTDLANDTKVYIGPGEARSKMLTHVATRSTTDRLLENIPSLQEWDFDENGIIDVFGDGSLWAIHVPGHTPGATAYLARTTDGPQLMIGDATHTRWGWDNQVEPGSYSKDGPLSVISLAKLKQLVDNNNTIVVHPGHQN